MDSTLNPTDINISRTGGSTILMEICGEKDDFWIITTTDSPEEADYGCLYFDDTHPMSRHEEIHLLKVLETLSANSDKAKKSDEVNFIIGLIKSKNQ